MEDLSWLGLTWDEGPDVGGPYGPISSKNATIVMMRPWRCCGKRDCSIPVTAVGRGFRPSVRPMPASIPSTTAIVMASVKMSAAV